MVKFTQVIRNLFENIRYAEQERKTPYIDHEVLKQHSKENRDLYEKKMNSARSHHENNDLDQAYHELFDAVNYLDTAILWEKQARLAKDINDNRDNVPLTLWPMFISYAGGMGATIPTISAVYLKGYNAPSNLFFWVGLIGFFALGFIGINQQRRLNRLVEEHKDYTRDFNETIDLIERKRDTGLIKNRS